MIFTDSNIWCYYFDRSAEEHEVVSRALEETLQKEDLAMNTVVLMEISHYLIKNLGAVKGKNKVEELLGFPFRVADFDENQFRNSVEILSQYTHTGIGGRDATILATMKKLDIKKLLTHDQSFKPIDFIEVVDPVEQL